MVHRFDQLTLHNLYSNTRNQQILNTINAT